MTLGLNDEEVKIARSKYGSNKLDSHHANSFFKLLIESLGDPIIKILLVALAIKIVFLFKDFNFYETLGIMIAVFLASFISTISEYGSNKAFERLQKENAEIEVKVYRNQKMVVIKSSELVVGDVIKLEGGNKIPADGHLVSGDLNVDESFLTGETKEIAKDLKNSNVYGGSIVYKGSALVKIDKVGINTFMGKISEQMQVKNEDSPLKKRLRILATQISKLGYLGAFLASLAYLFLKIVVNNHFNLSLIYATLTNYPLMLNYLIYCLTLAVTIIIMAVPEGLPMMITLVLSSNMKKMLKDHVLVRKMVGIETSGSLNVLLFDKTGTLTEGKLSLKKIVTKDGEEFCNYELNKNPQYTKIVLDSLFLNNECLNSNGKIIGGNATDQAIKYFLKDYQSNVNVISRKSFSSQLKYSYVYGSDHNYYLKGASEVVLPKCHRYLKTSGEIDILKDDNVIAREIKKYTQKGYRVLVTAYGKNIEDLIFIGFLIIKDSIRKDAKSSLDMLKKSGIKPVMITGDAKETAISIASDLELLDSNSIVLTHDEISKMSDSKLTDLSLKLVIVARALPEDKSRLVSIYKNQGLVVGMTGDGINDAIALKRSDVSFALGSGSDVAKEAADIVLLNDNISSICQAVLYGRTIFKSIRKFIIYQLTVNICALLLSIIGTLIGYTSPITIIQMLWLNMIMDTFAGLAFSYEPPLKEYMEEHPKKVDEKIINAYMLNQIIVNGLYTSILCIVFLKLPLIKSLFRFNEKYFLTAFFALFVFLGIINSFLARTHRLNILANLWKNKVFIFINLFIICAQLFIIYRGGNLFRTYGLTIKELLIVILFSLSLLVVDFLRKQYLKKKKILLGV